jgi:RHS repeat-associated protein
MASNPTYYHQDHLSVRLTTNASGSILTQDGTFPFGESWYQSGVGNKWLFTSYQRDSESGLDYALARYYDSRTGTFCSADPLAGDPSDPQSWNRYPYGRNNPIGNVDPSGEFFELLFPLLAEFIPELTETIAPVVTTITVTATTTSVAAETAAVGAELAPIALAAQPAISGPQKPPSQQANAKQKPNKLCNNQDAVRFAKTHEADAAKVAKQLNVPTENVLGLSARESGWGTGGFAKSVNAFFNLETKVSPSQAGTPPSWLFPSSNGWAQAAGDNRVFVGGYANYLASAQSFASVWGKYVKGISDPKSFLTALKSHGFNGGNDFTDPATINAAKGRMNCPQ